MKRIILKLSVIVIITLALNYLGYVLIDSYVVPITRIHIIVSVTCVTAGLMIGAIMLGVINHFFPELFNTSNPSSI